MTDRPTIPRVNVLGVGISALDPERALALVTAAAHEPHFIGYVTATGVHGVIESQDDPALKRVHNRSFLSLPDGTPLTWVGRVSGHPSMRTVYGPDFMRSVLAATSGEAHFFFGGGVGVVDKLEVALAHRYPAVRIVGAVTPPFAPLTPEEEETLVQQLVACRPHFVWVGLSTPKQERFMASFLDRYGERLRSAAHGLVFLGVGAAFDFLAGTAAEPPNLLRGTGLQWLYRMLRDPRRLGPRYLRNNPRFLVGLCRQWLRPERYPLG